MDDTLRRVLVVLSGGMDSVTLLHFYRTLRMQLHAVSFDYGQRHKKELDFARLNAQRLGAQHTTIDVSFLQRVFAPSSQTSAGIAVPHGHYTDESMRKTVVPGRNMVMLSLAISLALKEKCGIVAFGAHGGDHAIYPDCRPEFVDAMRAAGLTCDWTQVKVAAPFLSFDKGQIASLGHSLGVVWEETWSCYEGGSYHCGRCGTCTERREAFARAGIEDPTTYEG